MSFSKLTFLLHTRAHQGTPVMDNLVGGDIAVARASAAAPERHSSFRMSEVTPHHQAAVATTQLDNTTTYNDGDASFFAQEVATLFYYKNILNNLNFTSKNLPEMSLLCSLIP